MCVCEKVCLSEGLGVGGVGGGGAQPVFPYMQREVVGRRGGEGGRGHAALLYSHRYRGGISVASLQKTGEQRRMRRGRKKGGVEGGSEHRVSAMSSQHVDVMQGFIRKGVVRGIF